MKKLIIILFSFIAPIFNSGCLLEPDKEFVTDTLVVQVHDTTRVHDTTKIYKDTLFFHDTVRSTIIKKDTLWRHDTVRTTITKRDTLWKHDTLRVHDTTRVTVHDTVRVFSTNTNSDALIGSWSGNIGTNSVILTFAPESNQFMGKYIFTGNIGSNSKSGYVTAVSGNILTLDLDTYYPSAANWIFSISNNVLTLQHSGGANIFTITQAFQLNRIQ